MKKNIVIGILLVLLAFLGISAFTTKPTVLVVTNREYRVLNVCTTNTEVVTPEIVSVERFFSVVPTETKVKNDRATDIPVTVVSNPTGTPVVEITSTPIPQETELPEVTETPEPEESNDKQCKDGRDNYNSQGKHNCSDNNPSSNSDQQRNKNTD